MGFLTKILIFLGVVVGLFIVARMGAASALHKRVGRKSKKAAPSAEDLLPCVACGAYIAVGEACSCGGKGR
ncbi:MAG: hypothetical protein AAF401_02585 [Pseudomonadota bacterium]